jgi:hypothetical protein
MRVFISFAHADAHVAEQLEAVLRRNYIDT